MAKRPIDQQCLELFIYCLPFEQLLGVFKKIQEVESVSCISSGIASGIAPGIASGIAYSGLKREGKGKPSTSTSPATHWTGWHQPLICPVFLHIICGVCDKQELTKALKKQEQHKTSTSITETK